LEVSDYVFDHVADAEFFLSGEDVEGPCLRTLSEGRSSKKVISYLVQKDRRIYTVPGCCQDEPSESTCQNPQ
jgi:hypothetical protein